MLYDYSESNSATSLTENWNETLLISTNEGLGFINHPYFIDIDGDGIQDVLVHQGFLTTNSGSYFWLKGPEFTEKRSVSPETTQSDYFWHETVHFDLDQDGLLDLISTSANTNVEPAKKRVEWYRNLGNGNFEQHIINDNLGGVFIKGL